MSLRAIYFGIFCTYAVFTSCAVGQDPQRLELVDKVSKCGDWLTELEKYKVVLTQRRWAGSDTRGGLRHQVSKCEIGWNGGETYAYIASAEASEMIEISEHARNLTRLASLLRNEKNSALSEQVAPAKTSTSGTFDFEKMKENVYRRLQLLPVSKSLMENYDPKESTGTLIKPIVDDEWKLSREVEEEAGIKKTSCYLTKSSTQGFGRWTLRYTDSDSGAALVEKISYGISKRGRTVFESDEDIEAYLFSIETEYEEVDALDARLPVRITGEINDITTGKGGLHKMNSTRVVTTLDWSSFEKLSDDDLRKRTEKLMEEVENALQ